MKKIAIPLVDGKLCAHFGHCQQFSIIDIENDKIIKEELSTPPSHEPGLLPAWLAEKGVTEIIAGGMGQRAINLFTQNNINVNIGALQKNPKELVQDLIDNSLATGQNLCDH